jgi:hypothetical protein
MNEREFLLELQTRAREQHKVMNAMPFSHFFTWVSEWLGNHPWRFLIPLAFILTFILRMLFGQAYDNWILDIFGRIS